MPKIDCITHYIKQGTWTFHRNRKVRTYRIQWMFPWLIDLLTDKLGGNDCIVYFENGKIDCVEWYITEERQ
jgi:hypothetical protein